MVARSPAEPHRWWTNLVPKLPGGSSPEKGGPAEQIEKEEEALPGRAVANVTFTKQKPPKEPSLIQRFLEKVLPGRKGANGRRKV